MSTSINDDLKRCFEILGLNENSTLEDAHNSYRNIAAQRSSWDDIKEKTWAYDFIKEHYRSINHELEPEPLKTSDDAKSFTVKETAVISTGSFRKPFFISVFIALFILALLFLILRYNVFDLAFLRKEMDLSALIRSVKPAVVTISTGETQRGSGFLISKDGYIVTNAHVMREKTGKAAFSDGSVINVELVLVDPDRDFALLKALDKREFSFLPLGDSAKCSEGDTVIAAGTPLSFETSFTRGIVSSSKRSFPAYKSAFIQTDAALSPGNSGGPLINMKGEVVGINSLKISGRNVEGIGFAVSINDVKQHIMNRRHMSDDDLNKELARVESKIEEMNSWRDDASRNAEKSFKEKQIEEQWDRERRKKEFYDQVDEANKNLKEQRLREEKRLREEAEQYRGQMKEQMEARRKALSECLQSANYYYQQNWNEACTSIGQPGRCKLSYSAAHILEQRLVQQRNECFRLYPQ